MQLHHHYADKLASLCSTVKPKALKQAKVVLTNSTLAADLGISVEALASDKLIKQLFDPNNLKPLHSVAQKYGGHQFGHWNPDLGDGRGLLLGEITSPVGQLIDLHLKGAGPTPYSRHADGRAVLRSTIREYLASEALHALSIPSSRALCLIASEEGVMRESIEPGAMMIRTSPSHIRFGHFEYFHHHGQKAQLEALFDFCFEHHFKLAASKENPHLAMLEEIVISTASLVAKWQAYGFNHGVMNTDNMSIHGITFDYGPYAFLDDFIPNYICNRSDHGGRYAFDQQPSIALWNLNALAHGFSQYLDIEQLKVTLAKFEPTFIAQYQTLMHKRFGFFSETTEHTQACINEFMQILKDEFADLHIAFRELSERLPEIAEENYEEYTRGFKQNERVGIWCQQYKHVLRQQVSDTNDGSKNSVIDKSNASIESTQQQMLQTNPQTVLRNHHMQKAIAAAYADDFSVCESLLAAISKPFEVKHEWLEYAQPPSEHEKGIALSCSS